MERTILHKGDNVNLLGSPKKKKCNIPLAESSTIATH
jgi:hypothetical protein